MKFGGLNNKGRAVEWATSCELLAEGLPRTDGYELGVGGARVSLQPTRAQPQIAGWARVGRADFLSPSPLCPHLQTRAHFRALPADLRLVSGLAGISADMGHLLPPEALA